MATAVEPPLPEGFVLDDPPLPEGFVLDSQDPPLPPGFVLDQPETPSGQQPRTPEERQTIAGQLESDIRKDDSSTLSEVGKFAKGLAVNTAGKLADFGISAFQGTAEILANQIENEQKGGIYQLADKIPGMPEELKNLRPNNDQAREETIAGQLPNAMRDFARDGVGEYRDDIKRFYKVDPDIEQSFPGKLTGAGAQLVGQIALSPIRPLQVGSLFTSSYQGALDDYKNTIKKQGKQWDEESATKFASAVSIITGISEKIGLDAATGRLFKNVASLEGKKIAKWILGGQLEGLTEVFQGSVQDQLAKSFDEKREVFTPKKLKERLTEYLIGSMLGTGANMAFSAGDSQNQNQDGEYIQYNKIAEQAERRAIEQQAKALEAAGAPATAKVIEETSQAQPEQTQQPLYPSWSVKPQSDTAQPPVEAPLQEQTEAPTDSPTTDQSSAASQSVVQPIQESQQNEPSQLQQVAPEIETETPAPQQPGIAPGEAGSVTATAQPVSQGVEDSSVDPVTQQNFGPGAANINDPAFGTRSVIGIKNAKVDEDRVKRGLEPLMSPARKGNEQTWDEAMREIDRNPTLPQTLIAAIKTGKKKEVSDVEQAVLLHESIELHNEKQRLAEEAQQEDLTDIERANAVALYEGVESRLNDLDLAARASGTMAGRALQIRKMMAKDDFTLAAMERNARMAKGGQPLTAEESAKIKEQADKIEELEARLAEATNTATEKEATKAADEAVANLKKEAKNGKKKEWKQAKADKDALVEGIRARAKEGDTPKDVTALIQKLALEFVRGGTNVRDTLVDQVHAAISPIFPGMTRTQTRDAISGYGEFTTLDKEPAKVTLRQLKGEMQQIGKIEDMQKKIAPKATGMERRTPSDEERRLIKEVNELKKRGGFVVTDPAKQLKTALDAIKTRLNNSIRDLDTAIATKTPVIRTKSGVAYDLEATQLKAQRDALKAQYESIFGKRELTDEQRLAMAKAAAERSLADWNERLADAKKGSFAIPGKGRKLTSPEIEAIRAQRDAIQAEVEELKAHDSAQQEAKTITTLEKSIADLEERLKSGDVLTADKNATGPDSAAVAKLKETRATLQEAIKAARNARPETKQKALERAEVALKNSIAEYDRRLRDGDFTPRNKPPQPDSPEIEGLRAERNAMAKLYQELANPRTSLTPEEIALKAYKARTTKRIAELQDRIARGDFEPKAKKPPVALDAEAVALSVKIKEVQQQYLKDRHKDYLARRSLQRKIWDGIKSTKNAIVNVASSFDFSAPRQALVAILANTGRLVTNPIAAGQMLANPFPKMFKAWSSENRAQALDIQLRDRPNFKSGAYKQAGVEFTSLDTETFSKIEENARSVFDEWAKLPLDTGNTAKTITTAPVKIFSKGIRASNRAFITFLNVTRADLFDHLVKINYRDRPPTDVELKVIGNMVNIATGRGKLNPKVASVASEVLWAPKLLTSRVQFLSGQPLWGGAELQGSGRARGIVAKEYARILGAGFALWVVSRMFDDKDETDPRSSDFGKIVRGNTRIDPWGGLQQVTVAISRLGTRETKNLKGDVNDLGPSRKFGVPGSLMVMVNFGRSKLRPDVGAALDIITGEDYKGNPTTASGVAESVMVPLPMRNVKEILKDQGYTEGMISLMLSQFGAGVAAYTDDNKVKERPR